MPEWIVLNREILHHWYRIPENLTRNKKNLFLGSYERHTSKFQDDEGAWPFVTLMEYPKRPHLMILQLCTLGSFFWDPLLGRQTYSALELPSYIIGGLSLQKSSLLELTDIMSNYAAKLAPTEPYIGQIFSPILDEELSVLRIRKLKASPDYNEFYYTQKIDPILKRENQTIITVLAIFPNKPKPEMGRGIGIYLGESSRERLKDKTTKYFFYGAKARLVIDKQGMNEIYNLLRNQLVHLE